MTIAELLARAKHAYTSRHLPPGAVAGIQPAGTPRAGDLVLARVVEVGEHTRLEAPSGRRVRMFVGDHVVVAYGARYAPDYYESRVPDDLGPCHLVAAGGVAGLITACRAGRGAPTALLPVGLLVDADAHVLGVERLAPVSRQAVPTFGGVHTLFVSGTAMNSGKTTTAAGIARALASRGHIVGAAKATGTGSGGDRWLLGDAGAAHVLDMVDVGFVSTYRQEDRQIEAGVAGMHARLVELGCDVVVIEVADGLHHRESAALLRSDTARTLADGVVFAADSALAACGGVATLRSWGHDVPFVSGVLTASPLATREARTALDVPVVTLADLLGVEAEPPAVPEAMVTTQDQRWYADADVLDLVLGLAARSAVVGA